MNDENEPFILKCAICDMPIPKKDYKKYGVGRSALCKKCYKKHGMSITMCMLRTVRKEINKIKETEGKL